MTGLNPHCESSDKNNEEKDNYSSYKNFEKNLKYRHHFLQIAYS